jgi:hypothetical protein
MCHFPLGFSIKAKAEFREPVFGLEVRRSWFLIAFLYASTREVFDIPVGWVSFDLNHNSLFVLRAYDIWISRSLVS